MDKKIMSRAIDLDLMRPSGFHKNIDQTLVRINVDVSNKSGWKDIPACPICSSPKRTPWLERENNILVRCNNCTHGYSSRAPVNLSEAYENDEHFEKSINAYDKSRKYRIERFATERVDLLQKYKKSGNLLDFGCGTGWFLEHAQKFYEVEGFEPTTNINKFTRDLLKKNIHLKEASLPTSYYNIITAFDVIEHVSNPKETLNLWHSILKPGGIALIFSPNSDSISFEYMKENQNLVIPPMHLHYFNKQSFSKLIDSKFTLEYFSTAGLDVADIFAFERDNKNDALSNFLKDNIQVLQTFCDLLGQGNHFRAIIRKID